VICLRFHLIPYLYSFLLPVATILRLHLCLKVFRQVAGDETAATGDSGGTAGIGSTTAVDAHLVVSYLDVANLLNNAADAMPGGGSILVATRSESNGEGRQEVVLPLPGWDIQRSGVDGPYFVWIQNRRPILLPSS
jgi:hypothetical protein